MAKAEELFDLQILDDDIRELLTVEWVWQALEKMDAFLEKVTPQLLGDIHPSAVLKGNIYVAAGAIIGPGVLLEGPAWIGEGAKVQHGACVRGGSVLCAGVNVGHASEVKHSLLLPEAKAPHFNYVGDSILGSRVNIGAGVKIANFRVDGKEVKAAGKGTGLRKFGAALGDDVSIGCNSVANPGTIMGKGCIAYANSSLAGSYPANSLIRVRQETVVRQMQVR